MPTPVSPFILVKGAGEMASAVAWRLFMANMRRLCMLDLAQPHCVRRRVSFAMALVHGECEVEGVRACRAGDAGAIEAAWEADTIAVVPASTWPPQRLAAPEVVVDAILAKRNLATRKYDAPLVIALGPGFVAGSDCHYVIETNRGHDLGRIIASGRAQPNTGNPGDIAGFTTERVLRAPVAGTFASALDIGSIVRAGDVVGEVAAQPVRARVDGVIRGLLLPGTEVSPGMKLGDVDPRGRPEYCDTISEKARAISGAVLEAILRDLNRLGGPATC